MQSAVSAGGLLANERNHAVRVKSPIGKSCLVQQSFQGHTEAVLHMPYVTFAHAACCISYKDLDTWFWSEQCGYLTVQCNYCVWAVPIRLHASFHVSKNPENAGAQQAFYNVLAVCQENLKLKAGGCSTDLVSLNNADNWEGAFAACFCCCCHLSSFSTCTCQTWNVWHTKGALAVAHCVIFAKSPIRSDRELAIPRHDNHATRCHLTALAPCRCV